MPALTSIRALFAWWVVVLHAAPLAPFSTSQDMPLIAKGCTVVDCFFVLSGIVMWFAHPTLMRNPNWSDVRDFLVARLARIYPLHLTMLALFLVLVWSLWFGRCIWPSATPQFTAGSFLQEAFLLNGWGYDYLIAWNAPSWSVSSEWAAYLLTPLVFFALHRLRTQTMPGMVIVFGALIVAVNETWTPFTLPPVPRVLLGFVLGAALSCSRPHIERAMQRMRTPALVLGWTCMAVLAPTDHAGLFIGAVVWVMAFLGLRTTCAKGPLGRIERITLYLGDTSFATYLCHHFVLIVWAGWASRMSLDVFAHPVMAATLIAISVQAMASLLHHTVAEPARRMVRRWNLLAHSAAGARGIGGGQGCSTLNA
jgi:peptidoglycan/LPS O-acetylase OafA/YrhL